MVSIIVPCCNEQEALPLFYREVSAVLGTLPGGYELLFVNDGSSDGTLDLLRRLAQEDEHVLYLSFSRNFGKESAMYAGFCNARGDYVAVMDADLQHPPALLPQMLALLESGAYDSVAARRTDRKGEAPVRSWASRRFYQLIDTISEVDLADGVTDFRLMKRCMVDAIVAMDERDRFSKGIFGWAGFRTGFLPYENVERVAGTTKWSFWKLCRYAIDGIVNFSQAPLLLASWSGLLLLFAALVTIVFLLVRKLLFGGPVTGWTALVCAVIFVGGLQLLCLGIMGQYISKICRETKGRPHYILSETNIDGAEPVK